MAVLKDYKCDKHGYFESRAPKCPMKGCESEVMVVFLQAPGLKSDKTKATDKNAKQLAMDFGMTNIKTAREGENQSGYFTRNNANTPEPQREGRPGDAAIWGGQGGMNMDSILKGNMFKSVAGEQVGINPKEAGNLTGPRTASYIPDHQNLSIPKDILPSK